MQFGSHNVPECKEKEVSEFSEDKIPLHQKSKKRIYSSQDLHNIYSNMKNNEIPDTLLKKLVALKVPLFICSLFTRLFIDFNLAIIGLIKLVAKFL